MNGFPCLAFVTPKVLDRNYFLQSSYSFPDHSSKRRFSRQIKAVIASSLRRKINLTINIEDSLYGFGYIERSIRGRSVRIPAYKMIGYDHLERLPYGVNFRSSWTLGNIYSALYTNVMDHGGWVYKCYNAEEVLKFCGKGKTAIAIDFEPFQDMFYHDHTIKEETK